VTGSGDFGPGPMAIRAMPTMDGRDRPIVNPAQGRIGGTEKRSAVPRRRSFASRTGLAAHLLQPRFPLGVQLVVGRLADLAISEACVQGVQQCFDLGWRWRVARGAADTDPAYP